MTVDVRLKFWNRSRMRPLPEVVVLQQAGALSERIVPVAWEIIRHCGYGCYHPFVFSYDTEITVSDEYGNYSPHLSSVGGYSFSVKPLLRGRRLYRRGHSSGADQIEVCNDLVSGALDLHMLRSGSIVATAVAVPPGQKAVFATNSVIEIGFSGSLFQGRRLIGPAMPETVARFCLSGISSADIVLTDGGTVSNSDALTFLMENVVRL
jgi:hypothetical protein